MKTLADAEFVLLTTFRRDGTPVPTPVWAAPLDGAVAVWTAGSSGKVKRIRNNAAVTLAACDRGGTPLGDAVPAHAELLDATGARRVRGAIRRKYGLMGLALTLLLPLRSGGRGEAGISLTLTSP